MTSIPSLAGPEVPPAHGGAPDSLVIFAHGYGSNGQDLIGLVPHLQPHLPGTQFIAPDAGEPCPGSPGGRQWFALTTISREERDSGCYRAAPMLGRFIDAQLERFHLAPERLVLVGFSQGTMLALHVGLRRAEKLGGILGFSGSLASPGRLIAEMRSAPPVLLVHGANDEVVPVWLMFEAVGALEAAGVPVERHVSRNTAHSIAADGLACGLDFLRARIGGGAGSSPDGVLS